MKRNHLVRKESKKEDTQIEFYDLFPAMEKKKNVKDGQATGFTHLEDRLHTHTHACTQEQG